MCWGEREREVKCGEKSAKKVMKSRKKERKENQSFFFENLKEKSI